MSMADGVEMKLLRRTQNDFGLPKNRIDLNNQSVARSVYTENRWIRMTKSDSSVLECDLGAQPEKDCACADVQIASEARAGE